MNEEVVAGLAFVNGVIVFVLCILLANQFASNNGIEYLPGIFRNLATAYYILSLWTSITLGYIVGKITWLVKEIF